MSAEFEHVVCREVTIFGLAVAKTSFLYSQESGSYKNWRPRYHVRESSTEVRGRC